ncbi:MAG: ferrous iron transport protein A [Clostridiales bacterium]|nr:MAG: ferrous iron transport protein A [Clostridiales bacterium]HJA32107.1 ferrous iron transport protein A [Candidatus Eisenbergiella pullicola]
MTLYEGEKGCAYKVRNMRMEESLMRRLQALGLNEGTSIRVLNRKRRGALILYVRGTRLAVGKHISAHIEVDPEEDER